MLSCPLQNFTSFNYLTNISLENNWLFQEQVIIKFPH